MFAYDLSDIKLHPQLIGHQTIQHSFLNCKVFEATSFSTLNYFFQTLNSCRDFTGGWGNQLNLWCQNVANRGFECVMEDATIDGAFSAKLWMLGYSLRWKVFPEVSIASC